MKVVTLLLLLIPILVNGQSVTGRWTTIDETGEARSVVEIEERGGKLYGKVVKIFVKPGADPDPICKECPKDDNRYNKKIVGMEIIRDLQKSGDEYSDGTVLDPKVGKIYKCKIWVEGNTLHLRGYWGPFYRTQTWKKIL